MEYIFRWIRQSIANEIFIALESMSSFSALVAAQGTTVSRFSPVFTS